MTWVLVGKLEGKWTGELPVMGPFDTIQEARTAALQYIVHYWDVGEFDRTDCKIHGHMIKANGKRGYGYEPVEMLGWNIKENEQ